MTRIFNNPEDFRAEFLLGLAAAYPHLVRPVPGGSGVASVDAGADGRVGVVIGGGSGHYPAFAGLVGPGLCDAAVVGEIFTSPSAEAVFQCIKAADGGAGVLLSFGNYSGDVMHFGLAAQRARREGIDVRIVLVTDDVASADALSESARRGVAGGFYVFRGSSAAAHAGMSIDEVESVAREINARTRSIGIAFDGCTFPGATEPLFAVPRSSMAIGLGIHGEPGLAVVPVGSADDIARLLLSKLLDERPEGANRAHVLVNGLGATKYEELFVLFGAIATGLAAVGVSVASCEVGEFVTSLDMAGCSLTLCWAVPSVDALVQTDAHAPGYVRAGFTPVTADLDLLRSLLSPLPAPQATGARPEGDAVKLVVLLDAMADAIEDAKDELGRLDAVAGDGDHGLGMARGMRAAATAAAHAGPGVADVLDAAGMAFAEQAGGASGALWGAALCAMGHRVADGGTAADALRSGLQAIQDLGGAQVGDKTLVDAMAVFVSEFSTSRLPPAEAWAHASAAAESAATETASMVSKRGRAAVHGERGRGTPDPGAISFAIAVGAVAIALQHLVEPIPKHVGRSE